RLDGSLNVGLDHELELLDVAALEHLLELVEAAGGREGGRGAADRLARLGDLLGLLLVDDLVENVAGLRQLLQTEDLHRGGRARLAGGLAAVVGERTHAAPSRARDDEVAGAQGAVADEDVGDGAAAAVEVGLEDDALGGYLRVGQQLEHLRLEDAALEQAVDALTGD